MEVNSKVTETIFLYIFQQDLIISLTFENPIVIFFHVEFCYDPKQDKKFSL